MSLFEPAITITLANEGGYSCDLSDPGGETNFGISKRSYPFLNIKKLTVDEAKAIYLRDYWKFGGVNDQSVANKLFDMYVNMGYNAIKTIQNTLNCFADLAEHLTEDGLYGMNTENAINTHSGPDLLLEYKGRLVIYYKSLAQSHPQLQRYLTGWVIRAEQ